MDFSELNEQVRATVPGPDWFAWKGAKFPKGCGYATDGTIIVAEEHASPEMFNMMETLETPDAKRISEYDVESAWENHVNRYGVNILDVVGLFDQSHDDNFLYDYMVLFWNRDRDTYVMADGVRYRLLIDAVPVESLYGKGRSDPLVAVGYFGENQREEATGILAPVIDVSGMYMRRFRSQRPDLVV